MPIPRPRAGESQSQFISRCVSVIGDEYEQEQAVAICVSTYRDSKQLHCLNLETEEQREWLWKAIEGRREGFMSFAAKRFEEGLKKQYEQFANGDIENTEAAIDRVNTDPIEQAYINVYQQVASEFAVRTFNNFKSHGLQLQTKQEDEEEDDLAFLFFNAIKDFVSVTLIEMINSVTETTKEDLRRLSARARQQQIEEFEQFQKIVRRGYFEVAVARSILIARTEIIRASNKGMLLAAKATNIPMYKLWLSSRDNRVRRQPRDEYDHLRPDGQQQLLDDPFVITGERLMFPADPTGSAGNTINCRCTMSFQIV